ncbi:MAG: type I-F CRISPR-associated protein Csy1 [Methylococcaceae bacterium]|jgi:CRISPR-associated protein Csy1
MENTQQLIEDFFNDKIQGSISTGYEEILKPIRDKKKNHKHKEYLEKCTKEEDVIESNQWMYKKLNKLEILFHSDEKLSVLIQEMMDLYQNPLNQGDLKTNLALQFKALKKEANKSELSEQNKKSFEAIEKDKLQSDKFKKNQRLLEKLAELDPVISIAMGEAKKLAQEKFQRNRWISHAATKACSVSVEMTHIAKLTHSSARASNFNASEFGLQQPKLLLVTVNSVEKLPIDFTYSTAEYSPIAEFLQLVGKNIINNPLDLKSYAQNEEQLQEWQTQFSEAFNEKNKSCHTLVKQVYFPVSLEKSYHLLTPLVSSSLAQIIYDRIWATRQKDMLVREARRNKTYSQEIDCLFQQTAILKVTQSSKAHTNVSSLNVKRDGQLFLFPAIPPQWQTQIKPPIYLKTLFNKQLAAQAREPLTELKNLLLAIKANKLSVNLQRKQLIRDHINEIADVVFDYAAQIKGLKQHMGWSQASQLPAHQQYWLDPLRPDEDFQTAKATLDWASDIVIDFSKWINRQIKHKQLTLGSAHEKQWQKLFTPLLREFNALAEADLETSSPEGHA